MNISVYAILTNPHYGLCNPEEDLCYTLEGRTHDDLAKDIVLSSKYLTRKFNASSYQSYLDYLLYEQDYIKIGNKYQNNKVIIIADKDPFGKHRRRNELVDLFKSSGYSVEELLKK